MECIIRDDAYLSSNTVTALQKRDVALYQGKKITLFHGKK